MTLLLPLRDKLKNIIDPDFGLLDYLRQYEVIKDDDYDEIRAVATASKRAGLLLELIEYNVYSMAFLNALSQTRQRHVVNYIQSNGRKKNFLICLCGHQIFLRLVETDTRHFLDYLAGTDLARFCHDLLGSSFVRKSLETIRRGWLGPENLSKYQNVIFF